MYNYSTFAGTVSKSTYCKSMARVFTAVYGEQQIVRAWQKVPTCTCAYQRDKMLKQSNRDPFVAPFVYAMFHIFAKRYHGKVKSVDFRLCAFADVYCPELWHMLCYTLSQVQFKHLF